MAQASGRHFRRDDEGGRRPSGGRRRVASTVLIVLGIVLLVAAGALFVRAQLGYREAADAYASIANAAVRDSEADGIPDIDFDELHKVSGDIKAWIYVPGTPISYPVAQGADNNEYLRHLPDGTYNENGTIFLDEDATAPGMVDQQTTIYGHHMNDGSMFKAIDSALDQEEFDKIDRVYYITEDATYVLDPLFCAQVEDDHIEARQADFGTRKKFRQYLQAMLAKAPASAADAAGRIEDCDQVLTMVTCAGEIVPRTTRAAMVCAVADVVER